MIAGPFLSSSWKHAAMPGGLMLLASCSAHLASPTADPPLEFTTSAVLAEVTEIGAAGFCSTEFGTCEVHRLTLSRARPQPACPFIAVNYYSDTGHRYQAWPETLIFSQGRRWTLIGRRIDSPDCFYALVNAR